MIRSSCLYLFLVSVFILLSSCASKGSDKDNAILPASLIEIETLAKIIKLWSRDIGKGYGQGHSKLTPAYIEGNIFVADHSGLLLSLVATSGKIIWKTDTDITITGGVGVGETLVLVGSGEGDILAYTREKGEFIWQTKVSSEVLSAPQEAQGVVVVRTIDGKIFGLDVNDGNRLWVYDRTVPALTLHGTSHPVIVNDFVIAGFDGGRLATIELHSGKLIWETSVSLASGRSQLERMVDIDSEPVVIDDTIYVVTFQGRLAAVALATGRITWVRDISSYAGLTSDGKHIYITDDQSYVWALDLLTGNSLWKIENLYARMVTRPAVIGNFIVVGDFEGYLHWMDKDSGQFLARTKTSGGAILASPMVVEDIVYAYSSDGTLSAYTYH